LSDGNKRKAAFRTPATNTPLSAFVLATLDYQTKRGALASAPIG